MTATVDYHGWVRPLEQAVLTGPDEFGKCSVRVPLNSVLAVTFGEPEDIGRLIATLEAARTLLVNHQADVEAAQRARGAA
jgi:hypothetical protein